MKLRNLLNIFNKNNLVISEEQEQRYFAILRSYIPNIFPTDNQLDLTQSEVDIIHKANDYTIANIRRDDDRPKHIYNEDFLPYNIENDGWLLKYFKKIIRDDAKMNKLIEKGLFKLNKKFNKNTKIVNNKKYSQFLSEEDEYQEFTLVNCEEKIPDKTILKFIQTDEEFNEARNAYGIDLTRAQIKYMMNEQNKPNEVLIHHKYERTEPHSVEVLYHPTLSRFGKDVDKLFRNAALTGLTQNLGLNPHIVELGLEKYAPLWREQTMNMAFDNEYTVKPEDVKFQEYKNWYFDTVHQNLRGLWIRKREYEYGKMHQDIIKEANSATPNMKLDTQSLNYNIAILDRRYREIITLLQNKTHTDDDKQM